MSSGRWYPLDVARSRLTNPARHTVGQRGRPYERSGAAAVMLSDAPPRQLALPFSHRPEFAAADFIVAPSNEAALAWLARTADWPGRRLLLWGEAGCGKTHLLHLWAARTGARYVPAPALRPEALDEILGAEILEAAGGLALDDADAAPDAVTLLHCLNAAAEAARPVLLAARTPPARWAIALPDLASRLRATTAVEIGPAEDDLLHALLARLLAERQLAVAAPVQAWLLARLPRTPAALREMAARLDRAALGAQRAVTRALAGEVLAAFLDEQER